MIYATPLLKRKIEQSSCAFETELSEYLSAYGRYFDVWKKKILLYDFSSLRGTLIPSIPYQGSDKDLGHLKLRKHIRNFENSYLIIQCSSIGSLGKPNDWLYAEFGISLFGKTPQKDDLKLIYPSIERVRTSYEGYLGGNCLPYNDGNDKRQGYYLSKITHEWTAETTNRTRAMPHVKTFTCINTVENNLNWFIVSSANLSKPAWYVPQLCFN
jgi:tyrosyl-DNA phosphodiesterase-1